MNVIKMIVILALCFCFISCNQHITPPVVSDVYIQADYLVSAFNVPCMGYTESFRRQNDVYTIIGFCTSGETYSGLSDISEEGFRRSVYAADYMAANTDGGAYSTVAIPDSVPAGTVKCSKSADGVHTVCENSYGVITMRAEHPSIYGAVDMDGTLYLTYYNESNVPFTFVP